jgi:hypothetical protein
MCSVESLPTFRKNMSLQSSGLKCKPSKKLTLSRLQPEFCSRWLAASSSNGIDCEDYFILGCDAVWSSSSTFLWNYFTLKIETTLFSEATVTVYQTPRRIMPVDNLQTALCISLHNLHGLLVTHRHARRKDPRRVK